MATRTHPVSSAIAVVGCLDDPAWFSRTITGSQKPGDSADVGPLSWSTGVSSVGRRKFLLFCLPVCAGSGFRAKVLSSSSQLSEILAQ